MNININTTQMDKLTTIDSGIPSQPLWMTTNVWFSATNILHFILESNSEFGLDFDSKKSLINDILFNRHSMSIKTLN